MYIYQLLPITLQLERINNMNKNIVEIFTDGSCNYKNRLGGIGVYMRYDKYEKKIKMGYKDTSIGRMELKAVIVALNNLKNIDKYHFYIYSDSQYVVRSINLWMNKWVLNGWRGIKNTDLWAEFLCEYKKFNMERLHFIHVKGHTNKENRLSLGNEIADVLSSYKTQEIFKESDLL